MFDRIKEIEEEINYTKNVYFNSIFNNEFSKEDFLETQIQFFFAVDFFSRPMAALAAKIPTVELRREILRNVWEEHGEGDTQKAHTITFSLFLERLGGVKFEDIQQKVLWPEVRAFNTCLAGTCILDDFMIGTAMMGMIERMFCHISTIIARGVIERGWLQKQDMVHYNVHELLDIKHSQDFFDILLPFWEKSVNNQYQIEQGLRLGATIFDNLYTSLYQHRTRRLSMSCGIL
jgi:pyrroloquinoline-quinone synthase